MMKNSYFLNILKTIGLVILLFGITVFLSGCGSGTVSRTYGNIISSTAGWKSNVDGGNEAVKSGTSADISFITVTEASEERLKEIMTLKVNLASGTDWRIGEFVLDNNHFVNKLRNADGIKFTVIGDGKAGWKVMFPMYATTSDSCWHEMSFITKIGQSVQVDVPFSKLTQPDWGYSVTFNKSDIKSLIFQRFAAADNKLSGSSSIKIYNLEIY